MSALAGYYLFADFCTGEYLTLKEIQGQWQVNPVAIYVDGSRLAQNVTGFGEDSQGELYIATPTSIYKIIAIHNL